MSDTFLGLTVARRAGLSRAQVLNAMSKDELVRALADRKEKARARLA